jgi:Xaa-Pro aminopeptidase
MDYASRVALLQARLRRRKIDAFLVTLPENRRYLSGYTAADHGIGESSGALFIQARGDVLLLTDFRYQLQAQQETSCEVICYTRGLLPLLENLLGEHAVRSLGFESHYTLHSVSLKLAELPEKHQLGLFPLKGFVETQRLIKSEAELSLIRRSVALNEKVFTDIHASLSPGMTEIDTAIAIETCMRNNGAERPSFDSIVAAGPNSALPHAVPTRQKLGSGQPVTIDMGLILEGYCSDMTRSFVLGSADKTYLRIHRLVRQAQLAGINAVRPGATMKEVDQSARCIIAEAGYGKQFGHSLGHGVGLAVHENPRLSARSRQKLQPGMVVTVEPGIYIPDWGGVRLENMVVVREDGREVLNHDTTWLDI